MCIRDRYIERILLESRQLTPTMADRQLIRKISRHFGRDLQIAVITRGITTIPNFEALITEYTSIQPSNENNWRPHYRPANEESGSTNRATGNFLNKSEGDKTQVWQGRPQGARYGDKQFNAVNTVDFVNGTASTSRTVSDITPRTSTHNTCKKKHPCTVNDLVFVNKPDSTNNVNILLPDLRSNLLQEDEEEIIKQVLKCPEILIKFNNGITVSVPVSYTHLDVYKRQCIHSAYHVQGRQKYLATWITLTVNT